MKQTKQIDAIFVVKGTDELNIEPEIRGKSKIENAFHVD